MEDEKELDMEEEIRQLYEEIGKLQERKDKDNRELEKMSDEYSNFVYKPKQQERNHQCKKAKQEALDARKMATDAA